MITRDPELSVLPTHDHNADLTDEPTAEVDEPPEIPPSKTSLPWVPSPRHSTTHALANFGRRESLLTRQLHSEAEHTDDEPRHHPPRTLSSHSTWSNPSTTSAAELTSDDGRSVASPTVSPPFGAVKPAHALPQRVKGLPQKVEIVGQDGVVVPIDTQQQGTETESYRKRHITFACRGKQEAQTEKKPAPAPEVAPVESVKPARKCMLTFACPSKPQRTKNTKPVVPRRMASPPPSERRSSANSHAQVGKAHRGSDSTIHASPKSHRRTPSSTSSSAVASSVATATPVKKPKKEFTVDSGESDDNREAVRFHEFATSEDEPDDWVTESTCHRSRLTVNDTLKKENVIRKACEEVEEEAVEEDEEEEEELDAGLADADEVDDDDDDDDERIDIDGLDAIDEDDESDDGFHSDDEHGFANSDSEEEDDSDLEWWRPGGMSTAATSVDHLDRLAIINSHRTEADSSVGSASSGRVSPRQQPASQRGRKRGPTRAMPIERDASPNLPDSTDFVCGTLDEDRPLEQAYINARKTREAANRQLIAQDIDPTFPTSDPEMDEEDDEDLIDAVDSEHDGFMHGNLDVSDTGLGRRSSRRDKARRSTHRSPAPARLHSPAPKKRSICHSPPPKKKAIARSPAPVARGRANSPSPRKLFGHSPRRFRSPAPQRRLTSPRNSPSAHDSTFTATRLGQRPQPTYTSSLPRRSVFDTSGHMHRSLFSHKDETGSASDTTTVCPNSRGSNVKSKTNRAPQRGAIDIVKGLDKKRQLRKEKLYQKQCAAKQAAAATKPQPGQGAGLGCPGAAGATGTKILKPGRGAERMRAIGLQIKNYRGQAEHILSL